MRFDKLDPEFAGAQVNFDISRSSGWGSCFDRLGRYKTCESGTSGLYRRSGLGLGSCSRGLPERRSLRIGLSLSDILRVEGEWRFGDRSGFGDNLRLGLWWDFGAAGEIGHWSLLGRFWLDWCGFFRLDGLSFA